MEFKQLVMNETDTKYKEMSKGATLVPLSQSISVVDSKTYSQKRDNYLNRLTREKNAFNSAIKEIIKTRDERLKYEKQKGIEKKQKREKNIQKSKLMFYWIIVVSFIVLNLIREKTVLGVLLYNELNGNEMFSGLWPSLWPAWILISLTLLVTAIIGRKLLKDKDGSMFCLLEVGALLVFSVVLAFVFPPCDSLLENLIGLPILTVILYVVPVGVSGFISLAICGS